MDKKYYVTAISDNLRTYEDAEAAAKRSTSKYSAEYGIYQLVAKSKVPTPDIEVVKL